MISCTTPNKYTVVSYFDEIEPLIDSCVDKSSCDYDARDILAWLEEGFCNAWIFKEGQNIIGIAVTEVYSVADTKVCRVIAAGGTKIELWYNYIDAVAQWAKENGCSSVDITTSRRGWKKILKDNGFKEEAIMLRRKI